MQENCKVPDKNLYFQFAIHKLANSDFPGQVLRSLLLFPAHCCTLINRSINRLFLRHSTEAWVYLHQLALNLQNFHFTKLISKIVCPILKLKIY
jgi:hypothetical protein